MESVCLERTLERESPNRTGETIRSERVENDAQAPRAQAHELLAAALYVTVQALAVLYLAKLRDGSLVQELAQRRRLVTADEPDTR